MDELVLPLLYNDVDMELPLKMYAYGYTLRLEVLIGETGVIFEPDEEGNYRALGNMGHVEIGLLRAIVAEFEKLR